MLRGGIEMFVNFIKVVARDDDKMYKARDFKSLREYGMYMLNEELDKMSGKGRHITPMNIIEDWDYYEIRPVPCNSSTWYHRHELMLTLWYSLDVKPNIPKPKTKNDKTAE